MSNVDQLQTWLWLLLAFGLGAAVGFEREWRGHKAGIRTAALVALERQSSERLALRSEVAGFQQHWCKAWVSSALG